MERSEIRGRYDRGEEIPDCASLHPGYEVRPTAIIQRPIRMTILVLCHHAPFGDHGFADLPGVLRAGDFVDLDGNFLADEILQLRGLGVAAGDELERLRS